MNCNPSYKHIRSYVIILLLGVLLGISGATTFVVTNTNDSGPGSLRDAITLANSNTGQDTIIFNIPGTGPHTIFPLSQLPQLLDTAGVIIDGLSQAGASTGASPPSTAILMIEINGANAGASHGIWIVSPHNIVQGLVINNFEQDGIRIQGVETGTYLNYIYCNFIGTDVNGTTGMGNGTNQAMYWAGVNIVVTPSLVGFAFDNTVDANLISANYAEGVGISSCPPGDVWGNTVIQNYIGTDISGILDLGNVHDGVYIGEGAHDNVVDGNIISGNDFEGVCIVGYADLGIHTYANTISNNIIGLTVTLSPLGNTMDGVSIGQYGNVYQGGYAPNNIIAANTIAYNGGNGITVWEHYANSNNADGNQFTQNSIYSNILLGIDLGDDGVTVNDAGDLDSGANEEVNFPVILSANNDTSGTHVSGTVDIDTDPSQATVEIFKVLSDPSGYGEGILYLGSTVPDSNGLWNTTVSGLTPGDSVTATVIDRNLNTSEFSLNVQVAGVGVDESVMRDLWGKVVKCYPNPFKTSVCIEFVLEEDIILKLAIYDATGKLIKMLARGVFKQGNYKIYWNGLDEMERKVSPGVYFYRIETKRGGISGKLIFAR